MVSHSSPLLLFICCDVNIRSKEIELSLYFQGKTNHTHSYNNNNTHIQTQQQQYSESFPSIQPPSLSSQPIIIAQYSHACMHPILPTAHIIQYLNLLIIITLWQWYTSSQCKLLLILLHLSEIYFCFRRSHSRSLYKC